MPFKSEKQRRYLWANEPEIARDWTDTYGSRIKKAEGQLVKSGPGRPGYNGQGDTGTYGKAGQSYGDRERYTSVDVQGPPNIHGGTTRTIGPTTPKDTFKQSWTGPSRFLGLGGGYKNLNVPGDTSQGHQSRFGIGNLFRGAASMFGGIPGKVGSMLSHINPQKLRGWNEQYGRYNTQDEYEQARTNRRNTKRMDYLSDRKSRGLGYGKKAYGDLLGRGIKDPFQSAIDADYESGMNVNEGPFATTHLQSLADKKGLTNQLSAKDFINLDQSISASGYKPRGFMENLQSQYPGVKPARAVNPNLTKSMSWYNNPAGYKTGNFMRGLLATQDPDYKKGYVKTYNTLGNRDLTIGGALKGIEGGAYKNLPSKMQEKFQEHILGQIKEAGGFQTKEGKDIFEENFSMGAVDPTFQGGRLDVDESQLEVPEINYPTKFPKYENLWLSQGGRVGYGAGGLASLWPR